MATTTVLVTKLTGQAWIRDAEGKLKPLQAGMRIPADANVETASGSSVQLQADGQPPLTLGENQNVALNTDVFDDIPAAEAAVPAVSESVVDRLIAAINNGQDPFTELEPTAATLAGGGGGAGSSFVRLSNVLEVTSPLALAYPRGMGEAPENRPAGAFGLDEATPELPAPPTTYNGTLTLAVNGPVVEGSPIFVTATVSQPPIGSDLVIFLVGGGSITIPVGSTSVTVLFESREDEVFLQGNGTLTFEVSSTIGGDYDNLVLGSGVSLEVVDDNDDATAQLKAESTGDEDSGTVTYTVTMAAGEAPKADQTFTLTLSNGQTVDVTVPKNGLIGSVTLGWGAGEGDLGQLRGFPNSDVHTDPATVRVTDFAAVGNAGQYEKLVTPLPADKAVVTIGDSTTPATAQLKAESTGDEDSGTVTYTVTMAAGEAPKADQTFTLTLSNGQTVDVTVPKDGLIGSVTLGWGAGKGDLGQLRGFPNSDVHTDPVTVRVTDFAAVGNAGQYEKLVTPLPADNAVVTIGDSITPATAQLKAESTGDEDSGTVTYTVTMAAGEAPKADQTFTLTLSNGQTVDVTVPKDGLIGSVTLGWGAEKGDLGQLRGFPNSDVHTDPVTVRVTDFAAVGNAGQYEKLVTPLPADNAVVTIGDSITPATAQLKAESTGDEDSGTVTYTVTMAAGEAPKADQTFTLTLSNGQTVDVTVPKDGLIGSVTLGWGAEKGDLGQLRGFPNSDVHTDPVTVRVTDFAAVGNAGQYEKLVTPLPADNAVVTIGDSTTPATAQLKAESTGDEDSGTVTYTVTMAAGEAPKADQTFTLTLSNGQTVDVTVPKNGLIGSVTLGWGAGKGDLGQLRGFPNSDVHTDPATVRVTDFAAVGNAGQYEKLVTPLPADKAVVTIGDSTTPATAQLKAESTGDEDSGTVTYTVTMAAGEAPKADQTFTLTLSNGQTVDVTVPKNGLIGSVTLGWGAGKGDLGQLRGFPNSDVHTDPATVRVTDFAAVGNAGQYEKLVTPLPADKAVVTIGDSTTPATAQLKAESSGDEDSGTVTYTVTMAAGEAPKADQTFTLTLSNGQTVDVTVPKDGLIGSVTLGWGAEKGDLGQLRGFPNSDVHTDPVTVRVTDFAAVGNAGQYEKLVTPLPADKAVVTIGDSTTPATAQLKAESTGDEDSGTVTYTVTMAAGEAPKADQTFTLTLSNGQTVDVTVPKNGLIGSVTLGWGAGKGDLGQLRGFPNSDVHTDPATVRVTDFAAVGNAGQYEKLVTPLPADKAVVTIGDSTTPATAQLKAESTGDEDSGTVTYTVTMAAGEAPKADQTFTLTLSNGQTVDVTVPKDGLIGSVTLGWGAEKGDLGQLRGFPNSDVHTDPVTVRVTDFAAVGNAGQYEKLVTPLPADNAVVTIGDSITPATAQLKAESTGDEDSGTVTYTVTMAAGEAPKADQTFTLTLSNGQTVDVTVPKDGLIGSVTLGWGAEKGDLGQLRGFPNSDVHTDPVTVRVTDFAAVGNAGQYEKLVTPLPADNAVVTIGDSYDITTVAITAEEVGQGASTVTFKFELSNPPQGEASLKVKVSGIDELVTVTLIDGKGKYVANNTSPTTASEITITVEEIVGGNFERTDVTGATHTVTVDPLASLIALPDSAEVNEAGPATDGKVNLVLMIDISRSMGTSTSYGGGPVDGYASRLAMLKAALENVLKSGDVNAVFISTFGSQYSHLNNGNWYSSEQLQTAINAINGLSATDNATNYTEALEGVMNSLKTGANFKAPPLGGSSTVSLFISDGKPERENNAEITNATKNNWHAFLGANGFSSSSALGFGGLNSLNGDLLYMEPVGWDSKKGATPGNAQIVSASLNELNLAITKITSTGQSILGNLTSDDELAAGLDAGSLNLYSIEYDGETHVFKEDGDEWIFNFDNVATVKIYKNGNYEFKSINGSDIRSDQTFTVKYIAQDSKGTQSNEANFYLKVKDLSDVYLSNNSHDVEAVSAGSSTNWIRRGDLNIAKFSDRQDEASTIKIKNFSLEENETFKATLKVSDYSDSDSVKYEIVNVNTESVVASGTYTVNGSYPIIYKNVTGDDQDLMIRIIAYASGRRGSGAGGNTVSVELLSSEISSTTDFYKAEVTGALDKSGWGAGGEQNAVTLKVGTSVADLDSIEGQKTIQGEYGVLFIKSNGSYTYTANEGTVGGVEKFFYRIEQKDGDGDDKQATLTFNVLAWPGATSQPTVAPAMMMPEGKEEPLMLLEEESQPLMLLDEVSEEDVELPEAAEGKQPEEGEEHADASTNLGEILSDGDGDIEGLPAGTPPPLAPASQNNAEQGEAINDDSLSEMTKKLRAINIITD